MGDALVLRHGLQLAVTVGYAARANVIALGKEQFKDGAAVFLQALGFGADLHAFLDGSDTGGQKLVASFDLDQAHAAGANLAEAVHVAKGGDVDIVFPRDFKDCLASARADFLFVDYQSFDVLIGTHANTSTGASILQTPAGQRLLTMCSMYSCLKY